ncbi:unnamed protein product, partial [Effrenium voratum]
MAVNSDERMDKMMQMMQAMMTQVDSLVEKQDSLVEKQDSLQKQEVPDNSHKDQKKALQELKKRKGAWNLAPMLISPKTVAIKDIIMAVGKASWTFHAARARDVKSTAEVMNFYIRCAAEGFWKKELEAMVLQSLHAPKQLQRLLPAHALHEMAVPWHVDYFEKLMEGRAVSLSSFHCLPPFRYSHMLSE